MGMGAGEEGRRGLAGTLPINHDPRYHGIYYLSSAIIVLAFSKLASFVRRILQREENKGVEFTVWLWKRFAGRLWARKMFDDGHRFGRMEERGATKRNVNYPTLAQPNPQGWGTRTPGKKREAKSKPAQPIKGHSERSACITSMRAARPAGSHDATTATASSTSQEQTTA